MIYYTPALTNTADCFRDGVLGCLSTYASYKPIRTDFSNIKYWCIDNACYGKKGFEEKRYFSLLNRLNHVKNECQFVTIPDVVGDAKETNRLFNKYNSIVVGLGWKTAYVAQDGLDYGMIPWGEFSTIFIGGTTEFKFSKFCEKIITKSINNTVKVHIGRVNSKKRYQHFKNLGADSCDGTYLMWGPDTNLPKLLRWLV